MGKNGKKTEDSLTPSSERVQEQLAIHRKVSADSTTALSSRSIRHPDPFHEAPAKENERERVKKRER